MQQARIIGYVGKYLRVIVALVTLLFFSACYEENLEQKQSLDKFSQNVKWQGEPFKLMIADIDRNGLKDVVVIDHGGNFSQSFFQQKKRQFRAGDKFLGVGFHPDNILDWGESNLYVLAAEGENKIKGLVHTKDGFKITSEILAVKPRYATQINWPGWGKSLALSPFDLDEIHLVKDYRPDTGGYSEYLTIPLSERRPSVYWPGKITVTDINADGVDELLFVTAFTQDIFSLSAPNEAQSKPRLDKIYKGKDWVMPNEIVAADLTRDGLAELLLPDQGPPGNVNIVINKGNNIFEESASLETANKKGISQLRTQTDLDGARYLVTGGLSAISIFRIQDDWNPGEPLDHRELQWEEIQTVNVMELNDIDGDGWLDLIAGRSGGDNSLRIFYGPLWEKFRLMSNDEYVWR